MKKIQVMLEVCESEMEKLSDWEQNFIESISDQFTNFGKLSIKQEEILTKLYDKVV